MMAVARRSAGSTVARRWDYVPMPFGRGLAVVSGQRLVELRLRGGRPPGPPARRDPEAVDRVRDAVDRFFRGEAPRFPAWEWPGTTPFARRVYRAVARIPFGQVRSYGEVAAAAGRPAAARAVGRLMALNPLCLVVP